MRQDAGARAAEHRFRRGKLHVHGAHSSGHGKLHVHETHPSGLRPPPLVQGEDEG